MTVEGTLQDRGSKNEELVLEVQSQVYSDSSCLLTGSKDKGSNNMADLVLCTSGISSIF